MTKETDYALGNAYRFTVWSIDTDDTKKRVAFSNDEAVAQRIFERGDPNLFVVGKPRELIASNAIAIPELVKQK